MVIRIFFTDDTANTEVYCFKNKNPNSTLSFPKTDWYKYGIWLTAWVFIPAESSHTRRIRRRGGECHKKTIKIVLLGLGTIVTLNYCLTKLTRNAWESGISIYRSPAPLLWKKWGRRVKVLLPPIPDYVCGYAVVSQKILWNTLVSLSILSETLREWPPERAGTWNIPGESAFVAVFPELKWI